MPFFWAFLLLLIWQSLPAQAGWGTATATRHRIPLNGSWQIQSKGEKTWTTVPVPGRIPSGKIYFFRRQFVLPSQEANRVFRLFVTGINFKAAVKINNQYVGDVPAGFQSLIFPVDPGVLHPGKNLISLEVDTRQHFDDSLPPTGGFLEPDLPAGIFRPVFLESLPPKFLATVHLQTDWTASGARLSLQGTAASVDSNTLTFSPFSAGAVTVRLLSVRGTLLFSQNLPLKNGGFSGIFPISSAQAWAPAHPTVYRLRLTLQGPSGAILDEWQEEIGFRRLARSSGHFFLNGKRFHFRGLSLLTEPPGQTPQELGELLKRLGGNALHFIYPPTPAFFDVADSLGILIFAGAPLWNPPARVWKNRVFTETVAQFQKHFVELFSAHPSLAGFVWGNGLEMGSAPFASFLAKLSRRSGFRSFSSGVTFRSTAPGQPQMALNWLGLDLTTFKNPDWQNAVKKIRAEYPETPILLTQISAPLVHLYNHPEDRLFFEQRQAFYLAKTLRSALRSPLVDGCFVLTDRDFTGAYPSLLTVNSQETTRFPLGLFDPQEGTPRVAWKVTRDLFHNTDTAPAEWAEKSDPRDVSFILWGFAVIIFFLYFLKGNRRVSGNFARVFSRPHGFYQELESERRIAWGHSLIINFSASATLALIVAGIAFYYRESFLFDFFASKLLYFSVLKQAFVPLVWNPAVFVPVLTLFFFLAFSTVALFIQMATFVAGRSLSLRNALTLVYWLSGVFIFLAPVAMIVARIWKWSGFRWSIGALILLFFSWFVHRILLGMKVILHFSIGGTLLIALLFAALFFGVLAWIYESHVFFFPYVSYLIHVWRWGI